MPTSTPTSGGTLTSLSKTPQAQDDVYSFTEDNLLASGNYNNAANIVSLNVMSNDLGGNAKQLYSIDDGTGTNGSTFLQDLLTNNVNTGWETTTSGDRIRIYNGQIQLDITQQLATFGATNVNALAAGDHIHDSFDYTIQLGNGTLSYATVTVDIYGLNDAATITGTSTGSAIEAGGVANGTPGTPTTGGTLTVNDADAGQNHFQTPDPSALVGAYGTFIFDPNSGVWTYTLDQSKADPLTAGQQVTDSLIVKSLDGTASQTITVNITGSDDAPTVSAGAPSAALVEAGGVNNGTPGVATSVVLLTKGDVDGTASYDTTGWTAQGGGLFTRAGTYGTATLDTSNDTLTYQLDNDAAATQGLTQGQAVTDNFTVKVIESDGSLSATAPVSFSITGTNDNATITASATEDTSVTEAGGVNNALAGDPSASGQLTVHDVDAGENHFQTPTAATLVGTYGNFTFDASTGVWGYTLDQSKADPLTAGQQVTDTLTVSSVDGTASQTITVNINGTNDAAVISGATTGSVIEAGGMNNGTAGTPMATGTLTDTDVDNPANTFQAVTVATLSDSGLGSYTVDASGHWSFALDNNNATVQALNNGQSTTDTFTVLTQDGTAQVVTITIDGTNDAAVISGTMTGTVIEAGGVSNGTPGTPTASATLTDSDVDNPANTFTAVPAGTASDNGYGTFAMTAGGTWTYTLDNNNASVQALNVGGQLTDTFTVETVDGTQQQIAVTIDGTNDAAVISGATTGSVIEAGGVANGTAGTPTATGTLTDTDVDNPANTFQAVTVATLSDSGLGSYTVDASGHWSFTLDNTNATVQGLNNGQSTTDTFTVLTQDGTAQVVTITINGTNDAAVISGATTGSVIEAGGVNNAIAGTPTASATLTDSDVDNPANTFTAVPAGTASDQGYGTFAMTAGGAWSYTLDNGNATVQALNVGGQLTDTFTVETVDGTQQQITVTIDGANDAAVISGTITGTVIEAGGVSNGTPGTSTATGTLTDTDVDNPANTFQAVTVATTSIGGLGSYTVDASGHWSFTLDNTNATVQALNVGDSTTDTFTVLTQDGTAQTVTITIDGTNDAAVISGATTGSVIEAGGVNNGTAGTPTASATLTDSDVDNPANTFTAVLAGTASDNGYGTFAMTAGGTWTYTLDNNNASVQALNVGGQLTDTFTVETVDGTQQQIAVTIDGANDAAVISGTVSGTVIEAGGVSNGTPGTPTASATLTDTDVDNPANTFQAVTVATTSIGGLGSYTVDASGHWSFTLDNTNATVQALNVGDSTTDTFTVLTQDGTAQTVTITIDGTNDAAVISGATTGSVIEAGGVNNGTAGTPTASATLTDSDVDNPANTFTAVLAGTASDNGYGTFAMTAGGTWTYTLDNNNASVQALNVGGQLTDTFTVETVDGTQQQIAVTIDGANDAAVISGTVSGTVIEAGGVSNGTPGTPTASATLTDSDVDNPANTFTAVPAGTASDNGYGTFAMTAGGTWTYTLDNNNASVQALNVGGQLTDTFTVETVDGTQQQIAVTINGTNDAAVISGATTGSVIEAGGMNNGTAGTPTVTGTLTDTDVDNPANTFQAVTVATASAGGLGSYTVDASGHWSFTLDNTNATVQGLNNGQSTTDTFTVLTQDGTAQVVTITINGADDSPVLNANAGSLAYTENQAATAIDSLITASDVDSTNLVGATVKITGNFQAGQDILGFVNTAKITGSYNTATGVLTLSGSDTVANYQTALRSVTYSNSSDNPSSATRTISYQADDGSAQNNLSSTVTATVTVSPVNDAPVATAPTTHYSVTEQTSLALKNTGLSVSDVDGGSGSETATLSVIEGTLAVSAGTSGALVSGSGTSSVTISGTTAQIDALLNTDGTSAVSYIDNIGAPSASTILSLSVNDNGNTGAGGAKIGSASSTIDITTVTDTPMIAVASNTEKNGNENSTAIFTLTFLHQVANVSTADFVLFGNQSSAEVASVSATTGTSFNVTVTYTSNGGNGDHGKMLGINFVNNSNVRETASNNLAGNTNIITPQVTSLAPAGIAGSEINLGLLTPADAEGGLVTLVVSGLPSDWSLNRGMNNGDGTWTVTTTDPSSLTVTAPLTYSGATLLNITENWTNAVDGSIGSALVSDNVEAYAPGSPIFAVSGDDTLTGSGGNGEFVFAQPIGNDTVYNFDTASDTVDLIGFGLSGFAAVQAGLSTDASGNALITLGANETITLKGVDVAALTAQNFVFDQEPVTANAGTMTIGDGAILPLGGTIENTGTVALGSTGDETDLEILVRGGTLQGGGQVTLSDNAENVIFGGSSAAVLTNVDNTIAGAGQLGQGQLTLVNEGTIVASGSNALVIDTGANAVTNSGILEATGSGGLQIDSALANTGTLFANGGNITAEGAVTGGGNATIAGSATLEFAAASDANVSFDNGASGNLILDQSLGFSGTVAGFGGGDTLDLGDITFGANTTIAYTANAEGTDGTLSVSDGGATASIALLGQYAAAAFVESAASGGGTAITYTPQPDQNQLATPTA